MKLDMHVMRGKEILTNDIEVMLVGGRRRRKRLKMVDNDKK